MAFYTSDHESYRATVREFVKREITPNLERWEERRLIDRDVYVEAGRLGLIGLAVPEEFGGAGEPDYRYRMVVAEEIARVGAAGFALCLALQDDIVAPYLTDLADDEQKKRWLPGLASGDLIGAIGMTEPGVGSDLANLSTTASRSGDEWILNGQKTFISSGIQADLIVVAASTDPGKGARGVSLFVVEDGMPGFERGRKLDKVGLASQDTAELFFTDLRVPSTNLLGNLGEGFVSMMQRLPRERLSIAVSAVVASQAALAWTEEYVFERKAFGQRVGDFQNTRFVLAELETEVDITRAYVERCVLAINDGTLTTVEASKAKWWATEQQQRVVNRCLQLFGGYGFMNEYAIGRAYRDARIQTIYGGTTEIMKEIIGRDIAARHA
ncbi:acyl-CoA dehydrogenase family protein [Gordonia sp. NPDC003425]